MCDDIVLLNYNINDNVKPAKIARLYHTLGDQQ